MYAARFSLDWDEGDLDRDEAIERAFALGVAAECDEEPDGEYQRLVGVAGRTLVQMAYDDGRSRAKDLRAELETEQSRDAASSAFPDREAVIWSELVDHTEGQQTALSRNTRPIKRLGVPALLRRFDLSRQTPDDLSRLDLPEFLRK